MIKRIQSISGLGIFQNYRRDNNLQEFAEKNLLNKCYAVHSI